MLDSFNQTPFLHTVITIGSFLLLTIGLIGALSKKNLFKIFLSFAIAEASLFIYFIGMHFEVGKVAPILTDEVTTFGCKDGRPRTPSDDFDHHCYWHCCFGIGFVVYYQLF